MNELPIDYIQLHDTRSNWIGLHHLLTWLSLCSLTTKRPYFDTFLGLFKDVSCEAASHQLHGCWSSLDVGWSKLFANRLTCDHRSKSPSLSVSSWNHDSASRILIWLHSRWFVLLILEHLHTRWGPRFDGFGWTLEWREGHLWSIVHSQVSSFVFGFPGSFSCEGWNNKHACDPVGP